MIEIHAHNNHGSQDDCFSLATASNNYSEILDRGDVGGIPFIMELNFYKEVMDSMRWLETVLARGKTN